MQPYIEELYIKGFKSFSKPVRLKFEPQLGVIVGPNGSGKSNVLDSLCFTLGRLSTKSLRADNYSDLISRNLGKTASNSEVSITIHNDGSFPIDSEKLKISRIILKSGQTKYKLNGKNATRREILEILSRARVLPEGHNIILQGDVNRFVEMTPLERRRLMEEVSGIVIYEERKGKTLKELNKVKEKLNDAQIVLREKENYMDNLKTEKEEAEKYKDTIIDLKRNKYTLLKLKLDSKQKSEEEIEKEIQNVDSKVDKLSERYDKNKKEIEELREEFDALEEKIEEMGGGERLSLQKDIENLKINIEKSKNLEENSKNELQRIANREKQLNANLKELSLKIKDEKNKLSSLQKEKETIIKQESSVKSKFGEDKLEKIQEKIDSLDKELQNFRENKLTLKEELHKLQSDIDKKEYKLEDLNSRLEEKSKKSSNLASEKKNYKEIVQEIGRLVHEDSKLAVNIGDIKKNIIQIEDKLGKIRVEDKFREEFVLRDRAIKNILAVKSKGSIKGVHGTVMDLGQVDKEYSTALEVCAGGRLKNVVVDNTQVAIECLNLLKRTKSGVATFLPISKIRPIKKITPPNSPGVIGLASSLINCDIKYKPIFRYVFGNTIVVEDIQSAKEVGIGNYRMVTLNGDIFNISGAIQGGYRAKIKGLGFKSEDLSDKISEVSGRLETLKSEKDSAERKREEIESKLEELRKDKAILEGKLESYESQDEEAIQEQKKTLSSEVQELNSSKKDLEKSIEKIEKELDEKTKLLEAERTNIQKLRSDNSKKELEGIRDNRIEIESKLAQSKSVLENTLLPEKENINRVLKELTKEKDTFQKQITSEANNRNKLSKELAEKEKQEGSFYSKLKSAFKKKTELNGKIKDKERAGEDIAKEISDIKDSKNNIVIKKAKAKAEVDSLNEELKQYNKVEEIKEASMNSVRKKVIQLEERMKGFGQVNLKALEKWNELKKEFDDLTWKIGKLDSEREDIQRVIDKIEKKKREIFKDTFGKIRHNFETIFAKISKYKGTLDLENKSDPFEGGIKMKITKGSKNIPLASLSGGEKVITALGLIFAIQELEPAPFYLMDEIDAALDKVNSEKVAKLLKEYSKKAQVIIVSHNDSIVSEADQLYGVSMNKGISSVISLKV